MIIDIIFGVILLAALGNLWYQVTIKLPALAAVPDEVITERLRNDSSRMRAIIYHTLTLYRDEYFRAIVRNFIGKIFYRIHILLLRVDNGVVSLLKKMRASGSFQNGNDSGNGNKYSWEKLKKTGDILPKK